LAGGSLALQLFEPGFQQDLNGDGHVGPTTIEAAGATRLYQVSNKFWLSDSTGAGPSLKLNGVAVTLNDPRFGGQWNPIGAEQTASGYEVAWQKGATKEYIVWNADSSGNRVSESAHLAGGSLPFMLFEQSFHQDLNGDGQIGPTTIETAGSTGLYLVSNQYLMSDSTGAGPSLKYLGVSVKVGD